MREVLGAKGLLLAHYATTTTLKPPINVLSPVVNTSGTDTDKNPVRWVMGQYANTI